MTSVSPMVAGWPHSVSAPVLKVHAGNPISAVAATGRTTQAVFANCTTANALLVLGSVNRNMLGLAGTIFSVWLGYRAEDVVSCPFTVPEVGRSEGTKRSICWGEAVGIR